MTTWGYHCSHEQHAPSALLRHVEAAERAGFGAAMCSDHFHPWLPEQGQAGSSWAWLGAALQRTRIPFGVVTAPGQRQHPALVAQAIGTLAELAPGRLWVALGSGEALNERIVGEWPPKPARDARLKASARVIRDLLEGEEVSTEEAGLRVRGARVFTRPEKRVPLFGAALSKETAAFCGEWADGLITALAEPHELREILRAFRENGGEGKPAYLQAQHCWASTDAEGRRLAREQWRFACLPKEMLADLSSPEEFSAATRDVTEEDVARRVRVSSDLRQHLAWMQQHAALGFDAVFVHQVAGDQAAFIEAFGREVLPRLSIARHDSG